MRFNCKLMIGCQYGGAEPASECKAFGDCIHRTPRPPAAVAQDPVVEANREMLKQRSDVGIKKYGAPLTRTDLTLRDWLQHALEETLDQANYLQAAIQQIDRDKKHVGGPSVDGAVGPAGAA